MKKPASAWRSTARSASTSSVPDVQTLPVLGGRYRLGPEIGSGGMGAVHRAWDERFEREVAIKIVRSGGVEKERLRREAQYLAHLDHPNLVAVLDAGEDVLRHTDSVWFAMELVHGPDLRTVLRQDGPMDGAGVRRVLLGLLAALDALHAADVVHRDMKPANVLLTAEPATGRWDVKLVDLGIAQHVRTDHLTSTGQVVGTAAYLSPEQVSGRAIGPATDVYALGLLAIEALTARIAFPGGPAESAAARLVRSPDLPRGIDPSWRALLTAMTALDPADRPSVTALVDAVRRLPDVAQSEAGADVPTERMTIVGPPLGEHRPTAVLSVPSAPSPARTHHRPRRHLLVAACLLLAVVAAGGWIAALSGGSGPTAAADPTSSPAAVQTTAPSASRTATPTTRPVVATVTPTPTATPTPTPTPTGTSASPTPVQQPIASVPDRSKLEQRSKAWMDRLRERLQRHQPHR
jgi:serine/threonine protein kinase